MLLGIAVAGRSVVALALVALFAAFVDRDARLEEEQLHRGEIVLGTLSRNAQCW